MILLVLVAHDGKTLQLEVSGQTRVDAVQQALVSVTGISTSDQIVMCHGARLDPAKPLAAYKLPVADVSAAEDAPVFVYHKQFLRPGAAPPPQEQLPVYEVTVPGLPAVGMRHPLHSAHSPLIRALPDYEAQFTQQLGEARAHWEATQQRLHKCRQLLSEQEVQARAADAARANVESHYNYIASIYTAFVDKYVAQHRQHSALLAQFGELSAALASVALPPQLQVSGCSVLADLQPRVKLAEWHDSCRRSHEHFTQKVVELEGVFQLLRGDVERLFLQAPCVDLDALGQQLTEAEAAAEEQASIIQVLAKDLCTVQGLVESVVAQLGSSAGGASLSGAALHDSCAAVDTLLEQHLQGLLPRVRAYDAVVAEFLLRCAEAKACMTRDVLEQLQGIAAQQSRIRDMKHKLALLHEVLSRQAAAFAELQAANRLPAAYRLALAECARRAAWREMYGAQAARLAEHCGRITAKEAAKREAVNRQLERHLPHDLLAAAGLLAETPQCSVSLPPPDTLLLQISPQDIAALPAAIQAAADAAAADAAAAAAAGGRRPSQSGDVGTPGAAGSMRLRQGSSDGSSIAAAGAAAGSHLVTHSVSAGVAPSMLASTAASLSRTHSAAAAGGGPAASMMVSGGAAGAGGAAAAASNLSVENARLRAELAGLLAQQAARELGEELGTAAAAGGGTVAAAAGASQFLAGSTAAASSMALAASTADAGPAAAAAAGGGAEGPSQRPYGHGGAAVVPASVSAPLPDVSAVLAAAGQQAAAAAEAAAAQRALTLGPVKAALASKDELIHVLESRLSGLTSDLASYERRITALEAQLAAAAAAGGAGGGVAGSQWQASSSIGQQSPQQQQQHDQEQEQEQQAQRQQKQVQGSVASEAGAQSVAPAFLLEATQAPGFFGPAAAEGAADAAAAAGGNDSASPAALRAVQDKVATQHQQQQQTQAHVPSGGGLLEQQQQQGDAGEAMPPSVGVAPPDPPSTAGGRDDDPGGSAAIDRQQQQQQQEQQPDLDDRSTVSSSSKHPEAAGPQGLALQQGSPTGTAAATAGLGVPSGVAAASAALQLLATALSGASAAGGTIAAATAPAVGGTPAAAGAGVTCDSSEHVETSPAAAPAAAAAAPLSVSEPDLRGVVVASAAEVEEAHRREGVRLRHRGSLDSAAAAHAAAGPSTAAAAAGAAGGITGLLTSSVQYLFNRSSGSSSRGDSSSGVSGTPVSSPPPGPSSPCSTCVLDG